MKKLLFIFTLISILLPQLTMAALVTTSVTSNSVSKDQTLEVLLKIDTEGKQINAVGGDLLYSADFLEIDHILDGQSIVKLWVNKPAAEADTNGGGLRKITFSGLVPGGFEGANGKLFSVIFRAKQQGKTALQTKNIQVLEHSPTGNPLATNESQLVLTITKLGDSPITDILITDTNPPEPFSPTIAKGELFGNEYFLIFNAVDLESGISHYEILETVTSFDTVTVLERVDLPWKRVENPVRLVDQSLSSYIYLKAVDKLGNARVEKIDPSEQVLTQTTLNYSIILSIVTLITLGVIILVITKRYHARIRKQKFSKLENTSQKDDQ